MHQGAIRQNELNLKDFSRKLAKINKFENIKLKLKTNTEKKSAAIWRSEPFYGKILPKDFGLPPYHFRCRTEVVPVWIDE